MRESLKNTLIKLLNSTPIGKIDMYAGSTAPTGWKLCDGSAVSRTTYKALFDVIGTTYGSGDGSTTFNLPDLCGRFPLGAGTTKANSSSYWGTDVTNFDGGSTAFSLGSTGGETKHTLTESQMPSHHHIMAIQHSDGAYTSGEALTSGLQVTGRIRHYTQNTGGSSAHNNMPPYSIINFIIYVGG